MGWETSQIGGALGQWKFLKMHSCSKFFAESNGENILKIGSQSPEIFELSAYHAGWFVRLHCLVQHGLGETPKSAELWGSGNF